MSSSTDEEYYSTTYQKKRKISARACDNCRRRKIKCGQPKPPHNRCLNCNDQNIDCTFIAEPKKRGRPKGYAEGLEKRIRILEDIVKQLCPSSTLLHSLICPFDPEYAQQLTDISTSALSHNPIPESEKPARSEDTPTTENESPTSVLEIIRKITALSLGSQDDPFREDEFDYTSLTDRVKTLCIKPANEESRFWGKSSGFLLMQTAIKLKNEHSKGTLAGKRKLLQNRRQLFWKRLPWEKDFARPATKYEFPPATLVPSLIDAYFENVNLFYPLLHRPTFERNIEEGLHQTDEGFGGVFLLVCAVGSRYMWQIDKQALFEGAESNLSVGWKWYNQVQIVKQTLLHPPTLYDLQCYCLAAEYISGCYAPQAVWMLTGFGIRLAQDVGAHRRRIPVEMLTIEDELWKRAFWVLVALDRMISMGIGRPFAIFDDHFDVDMPIECDDEYWEHTDPAQRFKQPKDTPSTVTAFNQLLRLYKIMAFAMNTVYSIKTKFWELILKEWDQHIVAELDSALNNWISSLPEHLRWDPARKDDRFFKLSGSLITGFYYIQILIHRPYIGSKAKGHAPSLSFSSLTICTSAARSCSLVLDQQMKRIGIMYPYMQIAAAISGLVLLLNTWGEKKSGASIDPRVTQQVEICKTVLKRAEDRYRSAGVLLDVLNELTTEGQLLLPEDEVGLMGMISPSSLNAENSSEGYLPAGSENLSSMSSQAGFSSTSVSSVVSGNEIPNFSHQLEMPLQLNTNYQEMGPYVDSGVHNTTGSTYASFDGIFGTDPNIGNPFFEQPAAMDDTMAMWLNVPNGFEIDEWNMFLASFQG